MAKVYVADDEKNIRDLIASFLRDQGLEVEVFETGDQLLLRFMEEEADVVILDVMIQPRTYIDNQPKADKQHTHSPYPCKNLCVPEECHTDHQHPYLICFHFVIAA